MWKVVVGVGNSNKDKKRNSMVKKAQGWDGVVNETYQGEGEKLPWKIEVIVTAESKKWKY